MFKRFCLSIGAVVVVVAFTSVVGHGQSTSPAPSGMTTLTQSAPASAVISAWHAQFSKGWNPPKTPWGDPDLQGNFTSVDEINMPMERPAEFEGKNLNDVTPADLAKHNAEGRAEAPSGGFGGPPTHWYEVEYQKNSRPWGVVEPVDGKRPPLTTAAAPIAAAAPTQVGSRSDAGTDPATYLDWDLDDRCINGGDPVSILKAGIHGNGTWIVQTPDHVAIMNEESLGIWIIPIKGRGAAGSSPLPYALRPYWGDPVAWFEGNTLVIERVYHEKGFDIYGAPPQTTRTIERYTRRTNPAGIEWTATIENPTWWVRPWTWQQRLTEDDRQVAFEYACHEGNYSIINSLSGTRDKERRLAERAKILAEREAARGAGK